MPHCDGSLFRNFSARFLLFLGIAFTILVFSYISWRGEPSPIGASWDSQQRPIPHATDFGNLSLQSNEPTTRFRDNLLAHKKYITTWSGEGFTNSVMNTINLIYLGQLTDRIPIIPDFTPSKHNFGADFITFSEIFDVPRLRKELGRPILEWGEVKDHKSTEVEHLGCWSLTTALNGHAPPYPIVETRNLDVSLTGMPDWMKRSDYPSTTFSDLARFAFPQTRDMYVSAPYPSPAGMSIPPDEQLFCLDSLYFVFSSAQPFDWSWDYNPQWRHVGQYLHWTPRLERLARSYANRAFGLSDSQETPPYIVIHARHGDYLGECKNTEGKDCFPSISAMSQRVQEVRDELLETRGLDVRHVLMTSDEKDHSWWAEVAGMGWNRTDHTHTSEELGLWYPTLIDAVIQSGAVGFVGSEWSTMSVLAYRRSVSWHTGVGRMMPWSATGDER